MSVFKKIVDKTVECAKNKMESAAEKVVENAADEVLDKMGVAASKENNQQAAPAENTAQECAGQAADNVSRIVGASEKIVDNTTKAVHAVNNVADSVNNTANAVNAVSNVVDAVSSVSKLLTILAYIAVAAAVLWFFIYNPLNINYTFIYGTAPEIEKTENVVEKVRKISEFTTACYYEEYVIKKDKMAEEKSFFSSTPDTVRHEVVITVKGAVRAGFNLSALAEDDIVVKGDTIDIKLPAPEVFDVISNPSDYKIFVETGKWEHDEIVAMQSKGRDNVLKNALDNKLLERANKIGKERIASLFNNFGFTVVNVTLTELAVAEPAPVAEIPTEVAAPENADILAAVTADSVAVAAEQVADSIQN